MVLKSLLASAIEEGEEEDVYLRKCNIRKSRRQNEKNRKVAIQINEQLSLEKVPSPVPLPNVRSNNTATTKSPARKDKSLQSPYFPSKSRTNSTDDVYPAPSPPPRSPSFGSPVALGRTLALSLSLFSPGGFTISGSGRKPSISSITRSPEANNAMYNNGISYDNSYAGIQRAPSNESNGSWGEIMELSSPSHSPRSPVPSGANSNTDASRVTPTRSPDEEYYRDGEHNAHLRDSNRVKQFLFHRDRNRARKAQLLYPSGTYGNSCEFSPDLDEYKHPNCNRTPDAKLRTDRKVSSPVNGNSGRDKSRRNSGSFSNTTGSGKQTRKHCDERNIKVDMDTDQRSGSIGSVSTTPYALRRASFRVDSPSTPYAVTNPNGSIQCEGYSNSAAEDSPYYRAVTLGARNSPSVHNTSTVSVLSRKDGRTNSVSSVGSSSSEHSVHSVNSTHSPSTSPIFSAVHIPTPPSGTSDTYIRRRRDSITSPDSPSFNDRSVEIYETLFPALPVPPTLQKTTSNMSSILEKVKNIEPAISSAPASPATVMVVPDAIPSIPAEPTVPIYSAEQVCSMFHTALMHTGLRANNMPIPTTTTTTNTTTTSATSTHTTSASANTTRYRAWDDADSSEDESESDMSFDSIDTNSTTTSNANIHTMHAQVQKLLEVDATCGNLIQKCDYIYDIIKTRMPYKFDLEYVQRLLQPFLVPLRPAVNKCEAVLTGIKAHDTTNGTSDVSLDILFAHYVQTRLVFHLVQMLQFEDTRFESARLPILYVLYKSSQINASDTCSVAGSSLSNTTSIGNVSIRTKIAHAIDHTTCERHQRCRELLNTATASEMDVNFISKSGYSELVTSHSHSHSHSCRKTAAHPVIEVATVCDLSAVIQAENERSAYKTKDSEVSIIELMKYIIAHEVTELLVQQELSESRVSSPVRNTDHNSASTQDHLTRMKQRNAESRTVLLSLTRAYCSLFRCYTYKLGAHYAGSSDSVEQPVLLDYLMQILDGLLAWAKVLTSCIDMCSHSINRATHSPGRTKKSPKSSTKQPTSGIHDSDCDSKTVLEEVCECILQSAYKYWTNKLNYAQDVAYLLQCENVLTIYTPSNRSSSGNQCSGVLSYSAIFASTNRTDTATKATLPPLITRPTTTSPTATTTGTSCIVQKVLFKMLSRVCSQHVKVATQAMQSVQSPILMVRYFLPRMTTAMVTYIFGTEVGRVTFMTGPGWENSRREDCLNLLVDKLRECRNVYLNFSTQLQISSTQLLDTTLELLQVIEDAE